jgi:hypothetical protein
VQRYIRFAPAAALVAAAALAGCNDFLTGGELSTDPNRPLAATANQLFEGAQANIWSVYASDPSRLACIITEQCAGTNAQYQALGENFSIDENTTNGLFTTVYSGGGLIDIRKEQNLARQAGDSLFLGIAQVQEAMLMGYAADVFGDVPYTQVYQDTPPKLDPQMAVYDSLQLVLSRAIANMAAKGPTNIGPGASDLNYGGNRTKWTQLAHTMKARLFLHTAEVRGASAYQSALAEARQGITDPANNYMALFSGNSGEQNFLFQFAAVQRPGYLAPGPFAIQLMESRNDPRLEKYFQPDLSDFADEWAFDPSSPQPVVTAEENLLILAESAFRTGDQNAARTALNQEKAADGVTPTPSSETGNALLKDILDEKYIALYGQIEPWNDYKRNCYPNIDVPAGARGKKFPARLLYDTSERQTNPNIPPPQSQPARNANDPANATDPFGNKCLGQ